MCLVAKAHVRLSSLKTATGISVDSSPHYYVIKLRLALRPVWDFLSPLPR